LEERDIDENAVSAAFRNGVLTVTIPKSAQSIERTKRIPINVNAGSKTH
jgi:HSP20 family protein